MGAKTIGRYIVIDPEIYHSKPTFRGTRVMVSQVLEMVASGVAWRTIIEQYHGSITKEAIAEAVSLQETNLAKRRIHDKGFNQNT